jgi:hypothetical protein
MNDTIEMAREAGWWTVSRLLKVRLERFEALVRADERERLYGKDIDTLLFEEHRLGFEKGSRSEREACAKVCDDIDDSHWGCEVKASWCSREIRARGETK